MDPLSDVLEAVRLTGAVFFELHATQPWVAETPAVAEIVGGIFPGTKHLIPYHAVLSGECWAWPIHSPPVHLQAGDVVVFPHGDAHVVSSAPGMRGVPDHSLYRRPREEALPFRVRTGASGAESARIVCGYLGCDDGPFNPLLSALPATIAMHDRGDGALSALLAFALNESREPRIGSESVLGRLSELMFVEVLRRYVETIPPGIATGLQRSGIRLWAVQSPLYTASPNVSGTSRILPAPQARRARCCPRALPLL
jgi:hypothetical protein